MKSKRKIGKCALAVAVMALIAALAIVPLAAAQSCSMCYANAQQQTEQKARALNFGILILLVPSLLMFAGVLVVANRRRENEPIEESDERSFRIDLKS